MRGLVVFIAAGRRRAAAAPTSGRRATRGAPIASPAPRQHFVRGIDPREVPTRPVPLRGRRVRREYHVGVVLHGPFSIRAFDFLGVRGRVQSQEYEWIVRFGEGGRFRLVGRGRGGAERGAG